jgi:hypothetical protein
VGFSSVCWGRGLVCDGVKWTWASHADCTAEELVLDGATMAPLSKLRAGSPASRFHNCGESFGGSCDGAIIPRAPRAHWISRSTRMRCCPRARRRYRTGGITWKVRTRDVLVLAHRGWRVAQDVRVVGEGWVLPCINVEGALRACRALEDETGQSHPIAV